MLSRLVFHLLIDVIYVGTDPTNWFRTGLLHFDCPATRSSGWAPIWLGTHLWITWSHGNYEHAYWTFFLIDTLSHEKFTKVIITLWAIWGARRKAIHEEIFQSPLTVYGFITNYLAELNQIQTINKPRLQVPAVPPAAPGSRHQAVQ
jgi:hypothetical protein